MPLYEKQQNSPLWQPYASFIANLIYFETPLRALLGRIIAGKVPIRDNDFLHFGLISFTSPVTSHDAGFMQTVKLISDSHVHRFFISL